MLNAIIGAVVIVTLVVIVILYTAALAFIYRWTNMIADKMVDWIHDYLLTRKKK